MLRVLGILGDSLHPSSRNSSAVLDEVIEIYEERTERTLRSLYTFVSDGLASHFEDLRAASHSQLEALAKIADLGDWSIPKEVEAEMEMLAGRVSWRPRRAPTS